jgi:hypothetical protein
LVYEGKNFTPLKRYWKYHYLGIKSKVLLLWSHWFDPTNGVNVEERYELVNVIVMAKSTFHSYEPFVLAIEVQRVYYTMLAVTIENG